MAKQLYLHGEERTLADALEVCLKHSSRGPFTPREVELLRKAAK